MGTADQARPAIARGRMARALVALSALALALVSVLAFRAGERRRGELVELLATGGTAARTPELVGDVKRETDPVRAALRAARGLLADELDRAWQAGLSPEELAAAHLQGLEKLAQARAIATTSLSRRPASWQAAEVLGATRYLEALRRRLPMDGERRELWRRPLLAARTLAPGQSEPARFLAAATLSEWTRLPGAEREEAVELLRDAFSDPSTFDLLAASWLRLAPSRSIAFSIVPPSPRAWSRVEGFFAERGDWGAVADAHSRGYDALAQMLGERLVRAEERLRGGDRRRARWFVLEVLEKAPPSRRFRPLVERGLEILPAGPLGEVRARRLATWLAWSQELCLLGDCPFPPAVLERIAGLASLGGEAEAAAAEEMAGRPLAAERRATDAQTLEAPWSPYHLLRARRLIAAGDLEAARGSLARVHADWRRRAAYLELAAGVSEESDATAQRPRPRRTSWSVTDWIPLDRPLLELYPAMRCAEIEVELENVSPLGTAVEAYWDGDFAGTHAVIPGRPVRLPLVTDPGSVHRLEIDPFLRPQLRPARAALRNCSS